MHSVGRRLGKGYDLCMSYTTASTESPTVVSQRLQGPVLSESASSYTLRLCANPIAVSQLGVRLVPVLHRDTTRIHAMACLGCAGVGLPWLFDIWPALIPKLEAPCKTEKLVPSLKPTPESPRPRQAASSRIYLLRFPIAEFAGPVARAATT